MSRSDVRTSSETNAALDVVGDELGHVKRPAMVAGFATWAQEVGADALPAELIEKIRAAADEAHAKLSTKKARTE